MDELKVYEIDKNELEKCKYAVIDSSAGRINIELYGNDAPQSVMNFATLARGGFYKNLSFHRVIPGFMAQGGCPSGDGTGGPGFRIKCELESNPQKHNRGTISMAHAGRDTGGSQFFICFAPQSHLDGEHTAFGRIPVWDRASYKVLDSIKQGDKILNIEIKDNIERGS